MTEREAFAELVTGEPVPPLDADGLPLDGDQPDLSPDDERIIRELFPDATPFAEWTGPHQGERGGTYWLPEGQPDTPDNRQYGDKPDKAPDEKPAEAKPAGGQPPPAADRVKYGKTWDEPDWVQVPAAGAKPKWRNLDTGAERYGAKPRDRPPDVKRAEWESRAAALARPAAARYSSPAAAATEAAVVGPGGVVGLLGLPAGTTASVSDVGTPASPLLYATLYHVDVAHWSRAVYPNPDGTLRVNNNAFFLKPRYQGSGFGTRVFSDQVRAGFSQGVREIATTAGKGGSGADRMNGYYTWAVLGYDAALAPDFRRKLPPDLKAARTVQDLMATPAGAKYWQAKGYMTGMTFDLTPGSKSLTRLNAYLAAKGQPPIDTGPAAVAARDGAVAGRKARLSSAPAPAAPVDALRSAMVRVDAEQADRLRRVGLYDQVRAAVDKDLDGGVADEILRGSPGQAAQAHRNLYLYHTTRLGRERFNGYFDSPDMEMTHRLWTYEAERHGIDPALLRANARRSGWGLNPHRRAAVRDAYRTTLEHMVAAKAVPAARHAEHFAEVALAGPDGSRAADLLAVTKAAAVDTLHRITDRAVRRLLLLPRPETATTLYDDAELEEIAAVLAGGIATADLLGRARVHGLVGRAAKAHGFADVPDDPFFAFDEPIPAQAPAAAVDYFRRLVPTLGADPGRYGPLLERQTFTLAVAADMAILDKVKSAIADQLLTGRSAVPDVQDILDAAGVSPRNPAYSDMVVRVNVMSALNEGATSELQSPEMQEFFPCYRYDGILDSRIGEDHRPKVGRYYPSGAAFADVRGPRIWNCRCSFTPLTKYEWKDLERQGARLETTW